MSKNIIIQKDGEEVLLDNVTKLKTRTAGGGTQNWIPEDESPLADDLIPVVTYVSSSIKEGKRSQGFTSRWLVTQLQGGGTCRWVAEEGQGY